jgi:hypothetical protein
VCVETLSANAPHGSLINGTYYLSGSNNCQSQYVLPLSGESYILWFDDTIGWNIAPENNLSNTLTYYNGLSGALSAFHVCPFGAPINDSWTDAS